MARPDIDVVVELIGGIHPARELIEAALRAGKPVVSGNKALARRWREPSWPRWRPPTGVDLLYEAAVGGAIPVIRPLRESLAGEQIVRVMGIVNGTTNFILTRMEDDGCQYADALAEAQQLGLAERDPAADVEGHDAAAKAAILAALAFGSDVVDADVHREGITAISRRRCVLRQPARLLGQAAGGGRAGRRRPGDLGPGPPGHGAAHPPAGLGARRVQRRVRRGRGERRAHALRPGRRGRADGQRRAGRSGRRRPEPARRGAGAGAEALQRHRCGPQADLRSAFYLSMDVADRPGVLAAVASVFGGHDVSIRAMEQVGLADEARLIFLTHVAREGDVLATIDELRLLQAVDRVSGVLRVIGDEDGMTDGGRMARRDGGVPLVPAPDGRHTGGDPARGRHTPGAGTATVGAHGRAGLAQGGGRQPHRVVQGPGHDHGHLQGGGGGGQGGGVRVDREHLGVGRGLCRPGRAGLRRPHPRRAHRAGQAGAGPGARGPGAPGARQLRPGALAIVRELPTHAPITVVNSINPHRIEGQKTGAFEIVDVLGDAPDVHCIPVGNAGNITAYWKGYLQYKEAGRATKLPRMLGFQAAGAAPIVLGPPVEHPDTIATAIRIGNPASWYAADGGIDASRAAPSRR